MDNKFDVLLWYIYKYRDNLNSFLAYTIYTFSIFDLLFFTVIL